MDPIKIGKFILKLRKNNNLTQAEFAEIFGVTYQAVSKWENGKSIPDILILKEICKKYNIDINELLGGVKLKNKRKIFYFISAVITLLMIIIVFFLIYLDTRESAEFHFQNISSSCDNFMVYGNIAYNSNQIHINVLKIEYYGENDTTEYVRIETVLNQTDGHLTTKLDSLISESKIPVTLSKLLENIRFEIDNFEQMCSNFEETDLYLQIIAVDKEGNNKIHLIPLELESRCPALHSTTS